MHRKNTLIFNCYSILSVFSRFSRQQKEDASYAASPGLQCFQPVRGRQSTHPPATDVCRSLPVPVNMYEKKSTITVFYALACIHRPFLLELKK